MKVRNKYTIKSLRGNGYVTDFIAGNAYEAKIDTDIAWECYIVTNENGEQNVFSKDYFRKMFEKIEN